MKKLLFALALAGAALTALPGANTAEAARCGPRLCPEIYAPVICDNGLIYGNQCEADRVCATGCVPYSPGI
jgi:hypothetical protein